jgi:hypothetical protein
MLFSNQNHELKIPTPTANKMIDLESPMIYSNQKTELESPIPTSN